MDYGDILSDSDLTARDSQVLSDVGEDYSILEDKRRMAVNDWLLPRLVQRGYNPDLHTVITDATAIQSYDGSVYSDVLAHLDGSEEYGRVLGAGGVLAGTNYYLYVGMARPARGLRIRMLDSVNVNSLAIATVSYWNGAWTPVDLMSDATANADKASFTRGGNMMWQNLPGWEKRTVNASDPLYWVRVSVASSPSGGALGGVFGIAPSKLTNPAALAALGMIYRESMHSNRGGWKEKHDMYMEAAQKAMDIVAPLVAGEFDIDESGTIGPGESSSVNPQDLTTWERG